MLCNRQLSYLSIKRALYMCISIITRLGVRHQHSPMLKETKFAFVINLPSSFQPPSI